MKGQEIYPLVYHVVKRAQKDKEDVIIYPDYFEWSKKIPSPQLANEELTNALCSSVSASPPRVGLEIYFQVKVYPSDLQSVHLENRLDYLLTDRDAKGNRFQVLGRIVREVFEGRKSTNAEDVAFLESL